MKNLCISLAMAALALSASAERQSFDRYQSIVDRQMFGPPPEGFDPTKPPSEATNAREMKKASEELTKEQEKLKSAIRFSMINVTPSGETAVGFTDSSDAKNPKNYYLKVGESRDGWTVKEADPVASTMTVVKGEVEVSLTIGGDSGKGAGKTASSAGGRPPRLTAGSGGSLGARRSQRRAEESAKMEALTKQFQEREAAAEKRREEERRAREELEAQEKATREAEREEQRKQLLQIREELKRAREAKEKNEQSEKEEGDNASDS